MPIFLGALASVFIGVSDFLGRYGTRRSNAVTATSGAMLGGAVSGLIALALIPSVFAGSDILLGAASGLLVGIALALLYEAMATSSAAVAGPLVALGAAFIPLSWDVVRGNRPSGLALVGVVVASASWWFANARLRVPPTVHNVEQRVEWLYAFDVHCNSYFPLFLVVYVIQFFLVPVLLKPIFLSTLLANTLYGRCTADHSARFLHSAPLTTPGAPPASLRFHCTPVLLPWAGSRDCCVALGFAQVLPAATTGTSRFWVTRSSLS